MKDSFHFQVEPWSSQMPCMPSEARWLCGGDPGGLSLDGECVQHTGSCGWYATPGDRHQQGT